MQKQNKKINIAGKTLVISTDYSDDEISVIEGELEKHYERIASIPGTAEFKLSVLCLELADSLLEQSKKTESLRRKLIEELG